MKKKLGLLILVLLILIQFRQIDKNKPEYDPNLKLENNSTISQQNLILLKQACYDCHSNETRYPWYTNISPISWWIKGHINQARGKLNFSIWNSYSDSKKSHKLEECVEVLEVKSMPPKSYRWLHKESHLSNEERADLIAQFKSL